MPSKTYTYDVRIRASLDTSKVTGAGSALSSQVDNELTQAYSAGLSRREAANKASLATISDNEDKASRQRQKWQDDEAAKWITTRDRMDAADEKFAQKQRTRQAKLQAQQDKDDVAYAQSIDKKVKATEAGAEKQYQAYQKSMDRIIGLTNSQKLQRDVANGKYFGLDDATLNQLSQKAKRLDDMLASEGDNAGSGFWGSFKGALIGFATGILIGEVLGIVKGFWNQVKNAVQRGMEIEQIEAQLKAVSSGAKDFADQIRELDSRAQHTPGLRFVDAVEGEARLRAVGFAAKDALDIISGLAKVRVLSGASQQDMDKVLSTFAYLGEETKLTTRDIRSMITAMPALGDAFRRAFGTADAATLGKFGLNGEQIVRGLNAAMKEMPQAEATTETALIGLENSWDKVQETFSKPILGPLKDFFNNLSVALDANREMFADWGKEIGDVLSQLKGFVNSDSIKFLLEIRKNWAWFAAGSPGILAGTLKSAAETYLPAGRSVQPGQTIYTQDGGISYPDPTKSNQGPQGDTIDQQLKSLDDQTSASYEKNLLDLNQNLQKRKQALTNFAGYSKEQQLRLQIDLADIEKEGITRTADIEEQRFQQELALSDKDADTKAALQQTHDKLMQNLARANAAELLKVEQKLMQDRLALVDYEAKQAAATLTEFYNHDLAAEKGRLQGADTSTPGLAADISLRNFNLQMQELENQIKVIQIDQRVRKEGGYTVNGQHYDPAPSSMFGEIDQEVDTKIKAIKDQEITLREARNNQIKQESKTVQEQMLKSARLSLSTGNPAIDAIIKAAAGGYNLSPNIIAAMIGQESHGKNGLTSWAGAGGYMQLMPGTARSLHVTDVMNAQQNIQGGTAYLASLLAQTGGNLEWALAAYNSGRVPHSQAEYERIRGYSNFKKGDPRRDGYAGSTGQYIDKITGRLKGGLDVPTTVEYGNLNLGAESDRLTGVRDTNEVLQAVADARLQGNAPDDATLQAYWQIQVQAAKLAGKVQPKFYDIAKEFNGKKPSQVGEIGDLIPRPESYLTQPMQANEQQRRLLQERKDNFGAEIAVKQQAYRQELESSLQDEKVSAALLKRRDLSLESTVELEKQRNDLMRSMGDTERGLAVLAKQNADAEFVGDRRHEKSLAEQLDLKKQISDVEDSIANNGQNDELRITLALLQKQKDILDEHVQAMITIKTSQVDINRMMDVRADQIDAKILDHLAKQQTMTDAIANGVIDIYEGIAGPMEKGIDKLTSKLGPLSGLVGGILKTTGRSILTSLTEKALGVFGLGGLADKVTTDDKDPVVAGLKKQDKQISLLDQIRINTGGVGGVGGGVSDIASKFGFHVASNNPLGALGSLIGIGGTAPFNPGGGASAGSLGGLLGSLGGLTGGGGLGREADGIFSRGILTGGPAGGGGILGSLSRLLGIGGPGGTGLSGMLAGALPSLGLGLGASLGGGSLIGSLLGGAGGLLLGGAGAVGLLGGAGAGIFASGGLLASLGPLAGLLTNPFTIAAGAALIPLAIILGLNAKRRQAEQQRTVLWMDAAAGMNQLISGVQSHTLSPDDALKQADQIKADYTNQVAQLKDKKTRTIAMNMWNPPNDLYNKMEQLKQVADMSRADDDRNKRIIPEFADGGIIRARRGGTLARLGEGGYDEAVLSSDPSRAAQTAQLLSGFLTNHAPAVASAVGSSAPNQIVIYVSHEIDAQGMVKTNISTDGVRKELVKVINEENKNGSIK